MADNSHPLDSFNYLEIPLHEVEVKLTEAFGELKNTFEEVVGIIKRRFWWIGLMIDSGFQKRAKKLKQI